MTIVSFQILDLIILTWNNVFVLKEADVIAGIFIQTPDRYKFVDFPYPWSMEAFDLIIPYPNASSNAHVSGITDPYNYKVKYKFISSYTILA